MSFDALTALLEAGHPLEFLTDAQRAVFAGLSESEVELLNSIKARLEEADDDDVEGHELKVL
ncbi:aroma-sacti cluster domain-containing protein [Nonomuraea sp. NPDC048826]|uniref:aroma-sacti cluster domain-containing protein n=1 Tax=Nonomuraea sp. NPDC048826 TaxID=3364347 RepID=UPI00371B8253